MGRKRDRSTPSKSAVTMPLAASPKSLLDDDRPTELYDRERVDLAHSRRQVITGSTIREIMNNREHRLSAALKKLLQHARHDLPEALVDNRASLVLRHDFEFDRRVGYRLELKLFDDQDACVEVVAELDQDGRAIRRGSILAKLI